jgi:hypothetical protein
MDDKLKWYEVVGVIVMMLVMCMAEPMIDIIFG